MSRRLKLLGMVIAVVAFSAVAVAQASAAEFKFASTPTWLEGVQKTQNVLTVSGGAIKCSTAEFKSSAAISSASAFGVEVHPVYASCSAFGSKVSVETTSCSYILSVNVGGAPFTGLAEIKCSGATSIKIESTTSKCTVNVPSQSHSSSTVSPNSYALGYTSVPAGGSPVEEVLVEAKISGLNYSTSGAGCGAGGSNGTYSGTVQFGGYKSATFSEQHAISVG
jgi:hypothetical protein